MISIGEKCAYSCCTAIDGAQNVMQIPLSMYYSSFNQRMAVMQDKHYRNQVGGYTRQPTHTGGGTTITPHWSFAVLRVQGHKYR